jgi:hypothetical protein
MMMLFHIPLASLVGPLHTLARAAHMRLPMCDCQRLAHAAASPGPVATAPSASAITAHRPGLVPILPIPKRSPMTLTAVTDLTQVHGHSP